MLDKETFKALAVDSRLHILKLLTERPHTASELASSLGYGVSTIKEHTDVLVKARLIKVKDEGRKWKYYHLTFKGRNVVTPREVKVFFSFCFALLGFFVASGALLLRSTRGLFTSASSLAMSPTSADMVVAESARAVSAKAAVVAEPVATATSLGSIEITLLVIMSVLLLASVFLFAWWLKKPRLLVVRRDTK